MDMLPPVFDDDEEVHNPPNSLNSSLGIVSVHIEPSNTPDPVFESEDDDAF
jgi:hypothetical protein